MRAFNDECSGEEVLSESCMDALQSLSESSDDYLFVWEPDNNKVRFFGDIAKRYNLEQDRNSYSVEEYYNIVYHKDLPILEEKPEYDYAGKTAGAQYGIQIV